MKCKSARELFSLRIDGGLSFAEESQLVAHLESCTTCALDFRCLRQTVDLVRDLPEVPTPPTFLQDVLLAARSSEKKPVEERMPTLWERLRERLSSAEWELTPRLALAGFAILVLGIAVGIGGGTLIFRDHPSTPSIAERQSSAPAPATATLASSTAPATVTRATSGQFEDLVQQMMRRLEATQSRSSPVPDWAATRAPGPIGQQVGASPMVRRDRPNGGRVYLDF